MVRVRHGLNLRFQILRFSNLKSQKFSKISKFQEISGNRFDYRANFVFSMNFKYSNLSLDLPNLESREYVADPLMVPATSYCLARLTLVWLVARIGGCVALVGGSLWHSQTLVCQTRWVLLGTCSMLLYSLIHRP